jgi:hypothetical protein
MARTSIEKTIVMVDKISVILFLALIVMFKMITVREIIVKTLKINPKIK